MKSRLSFRDGIVHPGQVEREEQPSRLTLASSSPIGEGKAMHLAGDDANARSLYQVRGRVSIGLRALATNAGAVAFGSVANGPMAGHGGARERLQVSQPRYIACTCHKQHIYWTYHRTIHHPLSKCKKESSVPENFSTPPVAPISSPRG